jgi:hypothetical protein
MRMNSRGVQNGDCTGKQKVENVRQSFSCKDLVQLKEKSDGMFPHGNVSCLCVREDILLLSSFFLITLSVPIFTGVMLTVSRETGEIFTFVLLPYIITSS